MNHQRISQRDSQRTSKGATWLAAWSALRLLNESAIHRVREAGSETRAAIVERSAAVGALSLAAHPSSSCTSSRLEPVWLSVD